MITLTVHRAASLHHRNLIIVRCKFDETIVHRLSLSGNDAYTCTYVHVYASLPDSDMLTYGRLLGRLCEPYCSPRDVMQGTTYIRLAGRSEKRSAVRCSIPNIDRCSIPKIDQC